MNKIIHKIRIVVIALTIVVSVFGTVSAVAQAQVAAPLGPLGPLGTPTVPEVRITSIEQIYGILDRITGWLFIFFFAIAIIFILLGAFYYLIDDKEGKGAEKGKKQLRNAAIAIIIALVARGIPFLLQTIIAPRGFFF